MTCGIHYSSSSCLQLCKVRIKYQPIVFQVFEYGRSSFSVFLLSYFPFPSFFSFFFFFSSSCVRQCTVTQSSLSRCLYFLSLSLFSCTGLWCLFLLLLLFLLLVFIHWSSRIACHLVSSFHCVSYNLFSLVHLLVQSQSLDSLTFMKHRTSARTQNENPLVQRQRFLFPFLFSFPTSCVQEY